MENLIFNLKAGETTVNGQLSEKLKRDKKVLALSSTPLALILSACGSSSSDTASNLLTLTKSGETYSATNVTGFSVTDSSTAKFDISDATSNAYEIKLDATGSGVLEFDFADASDVVTFTAGSKVSGFTTLKVTDGTVDATNADLSGITRIEVASGIKISLAQIKEIPTIVANSATSEITVEVATEAEAAELVSLVSAGTVKVFGDTNPIKLVAASEATVTAETLSTKQTETTSSVQPASEAPDDTSTDTTDTSSGTDSGTSGGGTVEEPIRFTMPGDASGNYTPGFNNGDVTVTKSDTDYVVTPTSGSAIQLPAADVTSFVVNTITMNADAVVLDGETITGTGNVAITKLEGDAAADLSNITVSGTRTAAVSGDVTFTGDLGTFTTTVASGATLTGDVAVLQGEIVDGAGTVAVTDLDTDLDADLSTITATSVTATFNADETFTGNLGTASTTVATGKTLTAAASVVAGKTISGGTVSITGNVAADTNITSITSTVDFAATTPTVASSKTLTLTAEQAATESFANSGTVVITASDGAQSTTVTGGVVQAAMGAGSDTLILGDAANVTAADEINMGDDSDEVKITADDDSTGAVFDDAGAGFETLTVLASSTASENAKVSLNFSSTDTTARTIDASAMTDTSANFTLAIGTEAKTTGALLIKASGGNNVIAGSATGDILEMGTTAITADDQIDLGAGSDMVKITAIGSDATTPTDQVFDGAALGWETLTILENSTTATMDSRVSIDISSADSTARTINAAGLTTAGATFTLELGTAANVDGALNVTGGSSDDNITTGDGADTINGGAGADTLDGGAGSDTLDMSGLAIATGNSGLAVNVSGSGVTGNATTIEFSKGDTTAAYTTLANGKVAYWGVASESLTTDIDTVSNFEVYNFGAGADRFYGSSGGETVSGGAGADYILAGAGNDALTLGDGIDTVATADDHSTDSTADNFSTTDDNIAAGETITFGDGVDYISDFAATDLIDIDSISDASAAPTALVGTDSTQVLTDNTAYVAYGTWAADTGVFTVAAAFDASTAKDALLVTDGAGEILAAVDSVIILNDLSAAIGAANIV